MQYAVKLKNKAKNEGFPYEQVWCVFDRDEHLNIHEAINQAIANDIELAYTVPSFELWILLHFQDQSAHIERDRVNDSIKKHFNDYEKGKSDYQLASNGQIAIRSNGKGNRVLKELPNCQNAIDRADELRKTHRNAFRPTDSNPSTTVDELMKSLNEIAGIGQMR